MKQRYAVFKNTDTGWEHLFDSESESDARAFKESFDSHNSEVETRLDEVTERGNA